MFRIGGAFGAASVWLVAASSLSLANTYTVTTTADAIPAPPGSLREAILKSETHIGPDQIKFDFASGTIHLVGELPSLEDGNLTLGAVRPFFPDDPLLPPKIFLDGDGVVNRALLIHSSGNRIGGLGFIGIAGGAAVIVEGPADDNLFSGCQFGHPLARNRGAGLRLLRFSSPLVGAPSRTEIRQSIFVANRIGLLMDVDPGPDNVPLGLTWVHHNRFGSDGNDTPGQDNLEALNARGSGMYEIVDNLFAGPGDGVTLAGGAFDSRFGRNELLIGSAVSTSCGFTSPFLRVVGTDGWLIERNVVPCGTEGIRLAPGTRRHLVTDNRLGGVDGFGLTGSAIVVESSSGNRIRHNQIGGNSGKGIELLGNPAIDLQSNRISCNAIADNAGAPIVVPLTTPPALLGAGPLAVKASVADLGDGWIELFGDDAAQARQFLGHTNTPAAADALRHQLPVLGLVLKSTLGGTQIAWDTTITLQHTGQRTRLGTANSSNLSPPIAATTVGLAYDLIRGHVSALARLPGGDIDLGPVTCLANDVPHGLVPTLIDSELPAPGRAFFYVTRRDDTTNTDEGSYNPAVCGLDSASFRGTRHASSGDCTH